MKLCLVVAAARNNVIGVNNQLPWHLPEDLKYFKRITMGKPIVMGRKTFESIGRPLPGRHNIVITRQQDWRREGITVVHDLHSAIAAAGTGAAQDSELMVIGGAEIYQQALPLADRIYLTRVDCEIDGDAFFPDLPAAQWRQLDCEPHAACPRNPYDYAFCVLERVSPSGR